MARNPNESQMTLGEHLEELRSRLIWALLGLVPIVTVAFLQGEWLLARILAPARRALAAGEQFDITAGSPLETFSAFMRVSMIAAIVVGSPWIFYQLWRFVAPGLHRHEKRFAYFLVPLSGILTASGVVFLFTIVLPLILRFLIAFGTNVGHEPIATAPLSEGVTLPSIPILKADPTTPAPGNYWINSEIHKLRVCMGVDANGVAHVLSSPLYRDTGILQQYRVGEVLSMMLTLILAFAGAFQAPLVVLLLGWAGIVDRAFLAKYRRHAALVCTVIAALVMPGDPASMIAMAVPLYLLYELGGVLLRLFPASRVAGRKPLAELSGDEDAV